MSVSSVQPGYSIIQQSSKMADDAARDIQRNQVVNPANTSNDSLAFNKVERDKPQPVPNNVDALVQLNQAQQYSRVGTNVLQRDQDMIGSLLDISV